MGRLAHRRWWPRSPRAVLVGALPVRRPGPVGRQSARPAGTYLPQPLLRAASRPLVGSKNPPTESGKPPRHADLANGGVARPVSRHRIRLLPAVTLLLALAVDQ